jgi:ribosomal protein L37AE/L43A
MRQHRLDSNLGRVGSSPIGTTVQSDSSISVEVRIPDVDDGTDERECDVCRELKVDVSQTWICGLETWACEDCRSAGDDDGYSPHLEYKTRLYRGVED